MAGNSKIEQVIDDLERFIDNCKFQTLSSTKIIVNKQDIDEFIRTLRMNTPDEIKRYEKIIANRDAILNDAKKKAEQLINAANAQSNEMLNETEIIQQAYADADQIVADATDQARQILDEAVMQSNGLKEQAVAYVDGIMSNVQDIMRAGMDNTQRYYDQMMDALEATGQELTANRKSLYEEPEESAGDVSIDDIPEITYEEGQE